MPLSPEDDFRAIIRKRRQHEAARQAAQKASEAEAASKRASRSEAERQAAAREREKREGLRKVGRMVFAAAQNKGRPSVTVYERVGPESRRGIGRLLGPHEARFGTGYILHASTPGSPNYSGQDASDRASGGQSAEPGALLHDSGEVYKFVGGATITGLEEYGMSYYYLEEFVERHHLDIGE